MTLTNIRADNALATLVEAMTPRLSGKDGTGLYVRLDYRAWNYDLVEWKGEVRPREEAEAEANAECSSMPRGLDEDNYPWPKDLRASADIHLLFFRPTDYTQVYMFVDDKWSMPSADADWMLYSDHDTCWRDDGFRGLDEVRETLRKQVVPKNPVTTGHPSLECSLAKVNLVMMKTSQVIGGPGLGSPKRRRKVVFLEARG